MKALLLVVVVWMLGAPVQAQPSPDAAALHALFDRHWQWFERDAPEFSTVRGDHRFGDRLSDNSPAARAQRDAQLRDWLAQARALPRDGLSATDRVSLDLFIAQRARDVELQPFTGWRAMSQIGALGGVHTRLAQLLAVTPVDSRARVEQLLARLAGVPKAIDDEIVRLREGLALGYVPPREVLDRALGQLDRQLEPAPDAGPYYAPFTRLPASLAAAERAELQAAGRAAVEGDVLPAMRKLRAFVGGEYRARAPASGALSGYPDGAKLYEVLVRNQTTTALSAREIHALGLAELDRLRAEIDGVMRSVKFDGDFAAFIAFLQTDPRFAYPSAAELMAHYRDIGKRIDLELPRLFAELPRAPWGVREMPAHAAPNQAEYYQGPALDGSRGGIFFANAVTWASKRTWEAETLVAHEAVPGHHLQTARMVELAGLPAFRRSTFFTAYGEGWALYAETLGFELGLYTDPYARFGHLQWQAFRAARLVVDTGIHALGWPRQRAIDFMVERTGVRRAFVESEVDRYTSNPGQALAYMVGKLRIDALRERAKQRLGARFDIRRFHNAVLDQGMLPLDVLDRVVDAWIEQR